MSDITGISKHIGALERRAVYLDERLASGHLSRTSAAYERREQEAIKAGMIALRRAERYQDAGTSPTLALQELLDAIDDGVRASDMPTRVHEAIAHARAVMSLVDSGA